MPCLLRCTAPAARSLNAAQSAMPERLSFGPTSEILPTGQVDDYVEVGHV